MASRTSDLYQRLVIEHNRSPHNARRLDDCTAEAHGNSPLCGDDLHLQLRLIGDRIEDVGFQGDACAIATASVSLLTDACRNRSVDEVWGLLRAMLAVIEDADAPDRIRLARMAPDLALLGESVHAFPARHKCAKLPWLTLASILDSLGAHTHDRSEESLGALTDPELDIQVGAPSDKNDAPEAP